MKIIRYNELLKTEWKNGNGITREIVSASNHGGIVWRLSMADVSQDGAFSDFAGVMRILTVIKGGSMTLKHNAGNLRAELWKPVSFDGALKVFACLNEGALTDLNLMFDPKCCRGTVEMLQGTHQQFLKPTAQRNYVVHVLTGTIDLNSKTQLQSGDTFLIGSDTHGLTLGIDVAILLITIDLNLQIDARNLHIAPR